MLELSLIASGHSPTTVSTLASYISRHRGKLRNCLTIYQMLRCTHSSTPALQYSWCQEFWNYLLQNSYSYKSLLCFDSKHYQSHLDSLFISYFPLLYTYFPLLYTYIVHVAPGSLPFTIAPIIFFSSSLSFTAIFGHRSLFYGMDFRNGMVSHSGCFYSHIAAPCLVSCPMIITGRCIYGSMTFGYIYGLDIYMVL